MRAWLLLALLVAACAGEERSPLPYYGLAGQVGGADGASSGGSGQAGEPPAGPIPADVAINEVDPSGEPADWVELVNRGEQPVDVSGWSIAQEYDGTTPPGDADRVVVPSGTSLLPGDHLVLFTRTSAGPGPGDFGLSKSSPQRLSLFDAAGGWRDDTLTDASETSPFADGESWARRPDGSGPFARAPATPGAANPP